MQINSEHANLPAFSRITIDGDTVVVGGIVYVLDANGVEPAIN